MRLHCNYNTTSRSLTLPFAFFFYNASHRFRMKSTPLFAINVGFVTTMLVCLPSYYFCVRKREHKEKLIEVMMRANDFQEATDMPPETPAGDEHPFMDPGSLQDAEYVAHLPERKEWQTQVPQQDAKDVFVEQKRR